MNFFCFGHKHHVHRCVGKILEIFLAAETRLGKGLSLWYAPTNLKLAV